MVPGIIYRELPLKTAALLCASLGICLKQAVLISHKGIPVLCLADFHPDGVILHRNLAYGLRLIFAGLPGNWNGVLIAGRLLSLPAPAGPIPRPLLLIIGYAVGIDFKGHRAAPYIPLRGFHLHQHIGAGSQRRVGLDIAHGPLNHLPVNLHLLERGIGHENAPLISLPICLADELALVVKRNSLLVQTDGKVIRAAVALSHPRIENRTALPVRHGISLCVHGLAKEHPACAPHSLGGVFLHIPFGGIDFENSAIVDNAFPCLLVQLFNAQPRAVIPVFKVRLGVGCIIEICAAALGLCKLCGHKDTPGHQHSGVFSIHRCAHSSHSRNLVPNLCLAACCLISAVKHAVHGSRPLAVPILANRKISLMPMCLYDMAFFIKAYFIFAD